MSCARVGVGLRHTARCGFRNKDIALPCVRPVLASIVGWAGWAPAWRLIARARIRGLKYVLKRKKMIQFGLTRKSINKTHIRRECR
jgi:hypothetical protein